MAAETAEMSRNNIMLNAGISVLAQANQSTGMALKLLEEFEEFSETLTNLQSQYDGESSFGSSH